MLILKTEKMVIERFCLEEDLPSPPTRPVASLPAVFGSKSASPVIMKYVLTIEFMCFIVCEITSYKISNLLCIKSNDVSQHLCEHIKTG